MYTPQTVQNYYVAEDGATKFGYTMFGAVYGAPYAQWNALYVDWVLQKAAVPGFPLGTNPNDWLLTLQESDQKSGTQYLKHADPQVGDLVFVRTDNAREETVLTDAVGIVNSLTGKGIYVLQGDYMDRVAIAYYDLQDAHIVCYASLPVDPKPVEENASSPVDSPAVEQSAQVDTEQTYSEPMQQEASSVQPADDAAVETPVPADEQPAADPVAEKETPRVFFSDAEEVSFEDEGGMQIAKEKPEPEKVVTADPDMITAMQEVETNMNQPGVVERLKSFFTGLFKLGYENTITVTVGDVTVAAAYHDGVLPENAAMAVTPVEAESYADLVAEATGKEHTELLSYDISFLAGNQIVEPKGDVKISFRADFIEETAEPAIVHVDDNGNANIVEGTVDNGEISGVTDSFSVYVLSYTVDFAYSVNGKTYDFSLPGGGAVTLKDLVAVLEIISADEQADIDQFAAGITNAEFSNPELVWVGKAQEDGTVSEWNTRKSR